MIHFSTFADGDWGIRAAGKRLIGEAYNSHLFSTSALYCLKDLDEFEPNFSQNHFQFIQNHKRGFGLCFWKPTYLLSALSKLEEDDLLISLDAGCQLNINTESLARLRFYIELAREKHGVFMQLRENQFGIRDLTDTKWSNSLLVDELKPTYEMLRSNQVQAGIIIIRNSPKVRNMLQQWKFYCENENYKYLIGRDPLSESRWEQSIFSLLVKQDSYALIADETYWFPNWNHGKNFPIWAMRNRSGGNAYRRNKSDLLQILIAKGVRGIKKLVDKPA